MFEYRNLDDRTRLLMLKEIDLDVSRGTLYDSDRLSDKGKQDYPNLLREAVQHQNIEWLARQFRMEGRMNTTERKRKPKGGYTTARVPFTAPDTLAEGEFNRLYARAICQRAIEDGVEEVVVYRAKQVGQPRTESLMLIGRRLNSEALLADLRSNIGMDTILRLPPGPNSGLSIHLP